MSPQTPTGPLPPCGGELERGGATSTRMRDHARRLRRDLTPAERRLWHSLRAHRFAALGFRRQAPIGPYIADFICHAARLVVEIDGAQHGFDDGLARDAARDAWFASEGYRVLRFWNGQVLHEHASVLDTIYAAIERHS